MVFSDLPFLFLFLPITLAAYFLTPKKYRNIILFLSGAVFFAWGEPVFVLLLLFTVTLDYFCGRMIGYYSDSPGKKKLFLLLSVVLDLGILLVFKYNGFFVENVNAILGTAIPDPNIPLPLGISFYTFQSMSYTIDVYRGKVKTQKNYIDYGAYVMLFPQIVAGPIVRYEDVEKELACRTTSVDKAADGIRIFVIGLAKKVLLANQIGQVWTAVKAMDQATLPAATAWLGVLAFTLQIYYDFSGYSDMAIGMGKILGFQFPQNFDHPYLSGSVSEFWRRWHITLGSWFRDYVYIPLGGNRKGFGRTLFNLAVVWMLTGFWHGAEWNFVLWGAYFGLWIILEKLFLGNWLKKLPRFLAVLWTFFLVVIGWVLFEFDSLPALFGYLSAMFGASGIGATANTWFLLRSQLPALVLGAVFAADFVPKALWKLADRFPKAAKGAMCVGTLTLFVVLIAFLVDATYNPFLYFRF